MNISWILKKPIMELLNILVETLTWEVKTINVTMKFVNMLLIFLNIKVIYIGFILVPTMRGDFEILGYNMIHWLCGSLLWDKDLSDPVAVQKQKEKAFTNISAFLNKSFHGSTPNTILKYMTLLSSMKFNETPNYEKFKRILVDGLKQLSHKPDGELEFKSSAANHKAPVLKSTPLKVKKTTDRNKRSPRIKSARSPSPLNSLNDSTVGVVMDKKRGRMKDIKQILNDIDSDEEYDIKIVKKTKKPANPVPAKKSKDDKIPGKSRKNRKSDYDESVSDTEAEVIYSIRSFLRNTRTNVQL